MMFLFCIMGFAATNYFVGVVFLFMFMISAWYAYSVRSKVRFAGELLHEVSHPAAAPHGTSPHLT